MKRSLRLATFFAALIWLGVFSASADGVSKDSSPPSQNSPAANQPSSEHILIGSSDNDPPFSWKNFNREPTGFLIDLTRAIARSADFPFEFEMGDWNVVKKNLEQGQIDAVDGMYYSIDRDRFFDFSNPHSVVHHSLFVWEEEKGIHSLEDLRGRRVVAVRGDMMHEFLLEQKIGVDLILAKTLRDAVKLLSLHRAEAAVLARLPTLYYMKALSITNLKAAGKPLEPLDFCFAVKKGNQALLAKFNQGLAAVKASGEYEKLKQKWFEPLEPRRDLRDYLPYLVAGSALLFAVIFVLWFWNWLLQREVTAKTEALRAANEELRKLDQFKTDVVNMVAHEVRAPLSVMHGYADFLTGGSAGELLPHQKEVLQRIQHSVDWMNRLVNDLLDMAQLESGKLELHASKFEAESLVSEVAAFFEDRLHDKKIQLHKILEPENLTLVADRDRIVQCLINLVGNALKHTPPDGKITLVVKDAGQETHFEIHDTGSGMDEKMLGRLFQKFESGDRDRGMGYGLGLSITKGLVELHHGKIWVESQEGKGSMFAFAIPRSPDTRSPVTC